MRDVLLAFLDKEVLKPTNEYEFFRVRMHDHVVVVYSSGKIVVSGRTPENVMLLIRNQLASPSPEFA